MLDLCIVFPWFGLIVAKTPNLFSDEMMEVIDSAFDILVERFATVVAFVRIPVKQCLPMCTNVYP